MEVRKSNNETHSKSKKKKKNVKEVEIADWKKSKLDEQRLQSKVSFDNMR